MAAGGSGSTPSVPLFNGVISTEYSSALEVPYMYLNLGEVIFLSYNVDLTSGSISDGERIARPFKNGCAPEDR